MVWTKIDKFKYIKRTHNSYYVIYFKYLGDDKFTYINNKVLEYIKNKYNVVKLCKNQDIDIIPISEKHFKIVNIKKCLNDKNKY